MPLPGLLVNAAWFAVLAGLSVALPLVSGRWFAPSGALVAAIAAYPLWSWRRLEVARRYLDWQLQQLTGATADGPFHKLRFEQRIEHVKQAQQRFHDLHKEREETLAFLSHDIRVPLAAAVQQLGGGTLDEANQHRLFQQLRRAHKLAQSFLSLARVQSLEQKDLREIDLGSVAHQATDAVYESAQAKSVRLLRHIPDEPVWMRGDFHLLERALGNLLHNALRFSPEGGTVTVALVLKDGKAELSVADQGPGVSAEMLPHLFERFSTQKATQRPAHGTGLGLYFVHNVAERHGGQAGYEPLAPTGARLWMRLPLQ
jgi:signal transduction histidine kinase